MASAGEITVEWCDYSMNYEHHVVTTSDEALRLFEKADANRSPVLVDFVLAGGQSLTVAAGGEFTAMCFQADDPPYLVAIGQLPVDHLASFSYGGHDSEFHGGQLLPKHQAALAVREFVETGEPPSNVAWNEV